VRRLACGWLGFHVSGWFLGAHSGWPSWLVVAARIAVGVGRGHSWGPCLPAGRQHLVGRTAWAAATRRTLSRTPLSVAILLAVGAGVVLAYGFYWVIGGFIGTKQDDPAAKIDVYKTALAGGCTGSAGAGCPRGGIPAATRHRNKAASWKRFGAAAAQLGRPRRGGAHRRRLRHGRGGR